MKPIHASRIAALSVSLASSTGCLSSVDSASSTTADVSQVSSSAVADPSVDSASESNAAGTVRIDTVCDATELSHPSINLPSKLDVLILRGEHANESTTEAIKDAIARVPAGIDLRVGVMVAFGDRGKYGGKLVKADGDRDHWVLDHATTSQADLSNLLHAKLTFPIKDAHKKGEAESGLLSLNRALDWGKLESSREKGLFRKDAGLLVLFVSDQADACGSPDATCTRHAPAQQDGDGNFIAPASQETITAELVLNKLRLIQGDRPLMVAGIAANDARMTLFALTGGATLEALANASDVKPGSDFSLTYFLPGEGTLDASSVLVSSGGQTIEGTTNAESREIAIAGIGDASSIDVQYCENIEVFIPFTDGDGNSDSGNDSGSDSSTGTGSDSGSDSGSGTSDGSTDGASDGCTDVMLCGGGSIGV